MERRALPSCSSLHVLECHPYRSIHVPVEERGIVSILFEGHDLYVAHRTSIPLPFMMWFPLAVGPTRENSRWPSSHASLALRGFGTKRTMWGQESRPGASLGGDTRPAAARVGLAWWKA